MGFFCPITIIISFSRKTVKGFPKFLLFFLNYAVSRTFFRSLYQKELTIRKKHGIIKYSPTRTPPIRAVLSRCYTRNFFTSHPDDFIRRLSSHQIQTNVVGAPPIRVVLARCYNRRFLTLYPDGHPYGWFYIDATHETFLLHTPMILCGYDPPPNFNNYRGEIRVAAPDFFRQYLPVRSRYFPMQMFALGIKPLENFPFANPPRNHCVRTSHRG